MSKEQELNEEEARKLSDLELAEMLDQWADIRDFISPSRVRRGKPPLNSSLLREAARRLTYER